MYPSDSISKYPWLGKTLGAFLPSPHILAGNQTRGVGGKQMDFLSFTKSDGRGVCNMPRAGGGRIGQPSEIPPYTCMTRLMAHFPGVAKAAPKLPKTFREGVEGPICSELTCADCQPRLDGLAAPLFRWFPSLIWYGEMVPVANGFFSPPYPTPHTHLNHGDQALQILPSVGIAACQIHSDAGTILMLPYHQPCGLARPGPGLLFPLPSEHGPAASAGVASWVNIVPTSENGPWFCCVLPENERFVPHPAMHAVACEARPRTCCA